MLSSVLKSPQAVAINVEIMRVFVRLRNRMACDADLAARLQELEFRFDDRNHRQDQKLNMLAEALRQLRDEVRAQDAKVPTAPQKRRAIGFHNHDDGTGSEESGALVPGRQPRAPRSRRR